MEPQGLQTVTLARRTFYIEAVQVGPHNEAAVAEWCGGEIHATSPEQGLRRYIKVDVPGAKSKNQTMAFHGDWVLFNGKGFKVYTPDALWRDFKSSPEKPCDETKYTADGRPCVLGEGHRHTAALIGCRSFQDYLVVDKNYVKHLGQGEVKTDQFDRTGGIKLPASGLDTNMGPCLKESCA